MEKDKKEQQSTDRHLDIPSEANRDKHVNFYEDDSSSGNGSKDKLTEERRRQWQEGLREGEEARNDE